MAIIENDNYYYQRNKIDKKLKDINLRARVGRRALFLGVMIILLLTISSLNMFSATFNDIYRRGGLGGSGAHIFFIILGIGAFIVSSAIDYRFYTSKRIISLLLFGSLFIIWLIIIGSKIPSLRTVIPRINGAIGWIRIAGFSIQPSEFFKIFYIIILAYLFEKVERERLKDVAVVLYTMLIPLFFCMSIIFQEDLGSAIHYFTIYIFMLFLTKIDGKKITMTVLIGMALVGVSFYYLSRIEDLSDKGYKVRRIVSYLNGILYGEYDNAIGYQVGQALVAFGNGGIWGVGYGNGVQKYSYIPEIRTDFISTCFGEEFGLIGLVFLFICFLTLFNLIKRIGMESYDYFGKYLAMGIAGYMMTQVFINIFVATGLLPVFGIPMPLFSYGGTSIITILFSLGIVMNINKNIVKK